MEKTLSEALKEYGLVFMPSRNWAAKTRVNYRNDIADLLRFLERQGKTDPNRVDLQDLEAYMPSLTEGATPEPQGEEKRHPSSPSLAFSSSMDTSPTMWLRGWSHR